jgi:multidrug efflux pump subunit AcrB
MMRLQRELGDIILRDPAVEAFGSQTGSTYGAQTSNTGRFNIVLRPREERDLDASQVIDRLRPQLAKVVGVSLSRTMTTTAVRGYLRVLPAR